MGTRTKRNFPVSEITVVALTLVVCTACPSREDASHRIIKNPTAAGVVLAPDLPALRALAVSNFKPPNGAVIVPNGTKARSLDHKYLKGGRLVEPYPANSYDMIRDGAVEVDLIEITEGPFQHSKGWVQGSCLRPDFPYL